MLKPGDIAPGFRLPALEGRELSLDVLRQRGPVLLAFFKVNCPVCQYTFPFLQRLQDAGGAPVLGISQNNPADTGKFLETYGISFMTVLDDSDAGYPISNAYRITHVPSLFLIEPDGAVSLASSGFSRLDIEMLAQRTRSAAIFAREKDVPEYKPG